MSNIEYALNALAMTAVVLAWMYLFNMWGDD